MRILPAARTAAFGAVQRLFSEMRALGELNNPHLVAVTDLIEGREAGAVSAIVMELVEGRPLSRVLGAEKTLPMRRIGAVLGPVLDALRAVHQVQLVHGDLKPENILLTGDGDTGVKVLGAGLGRSVTASRASEDRWGPDEDTSINTPAYLAPEQAFGKEVDRRTDIYSFGVVLYQVLCGRPPFGGRNLSELMVELEMDPPRPTPRPVLADPIGRQLDFIARRCLEKDPARRWASVDELKDAFDGVFAGRPIEELMDAASAAPASPRATRKWLLAAAAGAAVVVIGGMYLIL